MQYENDVLVLRELARQYAQIAHHPHNDQSRILHRANNDLQMIRPVVLINELPWGELACDMLTLHCQDPEFRACENYMRRMLYRFAHCRGDMVVRPYLPVAKIIHTTGFGVSIAEETLKDNQDSDIMAHAYQDQFEDCEGLDRLHNEVITYDEAETNRIFCKISEAVGDIIPVRKTGRDVYTVVTWDRIAELRGVEPLLMDLLVEPEFSHALVSKMTDIAINTRNQYLKLGLFDTDPEYLHCTPVLNSTLHPEEDNTDLKNIWGRGAAQIFASVSSQMHDEFDINYMIKALEGCGLVYYGCCEPLDKKIDIVEKIPNLRKISITPWADVAVAAQAIGKKYVLASKPNPSVLSLGKLDEAELKKEIIKIMDASYQNGCALEMVLKDISTVGHNPADLMKWENIVMDIVTHY